MEGLPIKQSVSGDIPKVSVIIPCFNHARFLPTAIESALNQTYKHIEVVVVDDGSSDNSREVAEKYNGVKYVYQNNQGLAAARNTGIDNSTSDYLLFLDADDWLLPQGVESNISYFKNAEKIGFVSGNYVSHYETDDTEKEMVRLVKKSPYADLLLYNHVKMHASVLFPRWIFNECRYDSQLNASEDWDLYLQITRNYSIVQHTTPIAVYRRYGTSMSRNNVVMLKTGLRVLEKQKDQVKTSLERKNLVKGKRYVTQKFTKRIYKHLMREQRSGAQQLDVLFRYNKILFAKYVLTRMKTFLQMKKSASSFSL